MGLPLLLPLLLLPVSLQAGKGARSPGPTESHAQCKSNHPFEVEQPENLSASEGGSIHIPFSFCYHWKLAKDPKVRIFWRREHFHGEFIYNTTPPFTHEDYTGRLSLYWSEGERNGSLHISDLRKEDQGPYFGRVQLTTQSAGRQVWQSIKGTTLNVTRAPKKPTEGPTSTVTTSTVSATDSKQSGHLTLGATVGVALASAVLIITILALMVYLRCKRSKGLHTEAGAPAKESLHITEKSENTGNKGEHEDPKLDPKDDGIFYASLELSSSTSPSVPPSHLPHNGPQEETVYSILKA